MDLDSLRNYRRKVTFDPSISVGNILSIVTMIALGVGAWTSLDKRVVVLEEAKLYQASRDAGQDAAIREKFETIKETIADVRSAVYQLGRDGRERDSQRQIPPQGSPRK